MTFETLGPQHGIHRIALMSERGPSTTTHVLDAVDVTCKDSILQQDRTISEACGDPTSVKYRHRRLTIGLHCDRAITPIVRRRQTPRVQHRVNVAEESSATGTRHEEQSKDG